MGSERRRDGERAGVTRVSPRVGWAADDAGSGKGKANEKRTLQPAHLKRSDKWHRMGYAGIVTATVALAMTTPRIKVFDEEGRLEGKWIVIMCMLLAACLGSLLAVQGSDPGYLELGKDIELVETATTLPLDHVEADTEEKQDTRERSSEDVELLDKSDDESDSDEEEGFILEIEPTEGEDAKLANVNPATVPLRAKYCRNSRMYIATFDHFCGILGTPIGERNHCRFWWFLMFHATGLAVLIRVVFSGFQDTKAEVTVWFNHNGHAFAAAMFLIILQMTVGGLLLFHTFLATANMTSYEFLRSDKVSYLKGTGDFDLPFSRGLRNNLWRFCILDGLFAALKARAEWRPRRWEILLPDRDSEDVWNNIWENKYWSCC